MTTTKHKETKTMTSSAKIVGVWIVSGEGETGTSRRVDSRTARGLRWMLTRESCGGDRWARVEMETDAYERMPVDPSEVERLATRCPGCGCSGDMGRARPMIGYISPRCPGCLADQHEIAREIING